jgi:hypothetical protein
MIAEAKDAYAAEIAAYLKARSASETAIAWHHLERAHILGQPFFGLHLHSHIKMLGYAVFLRDGKEVTGQLMRLALAPLGNISGKLPIGNTGRSNVSAFQAMDVPADLKAKLCKRQ